MLLRELLNKHTNNEDYIRLMNSKIILLLFLITLDLASILVDCKVGTGIAVEAMKLR